MKNKLKTAFTLLVYIAVTVGIYALICHLNHQPFAHTVCRTDRLRSLPSPTPDGSQITKEPEIAL